MCALVARLLPLPLLICLYAGSALAQQNGPSLSLGDAVVTGFSGTASQPGNPPAKKPAADITFIDPNGASARVVKIGRPGFVWDGRVFAAPKSFDVRAKDVGQVFGVALDDQAAPNIYLGATSAFGLNIVGRTREGAVERRKAGGPGTGWMAGQFGLDLQGDPGSIYKVDGRTGAVTLFTKVMLDGVPNPGPALGGLAYDAAHKQIFVSDLYTGMVHRFAIADGAEAGPYFDHGVTGRGAGNLPPLGFSAANRPNIASPRFKSDDPESWGFAPPERRVWALAVHEGRLFYSARNGAAQAAPQIWSVGIARDGSFAPDARFELDVPAQPGPYPVSDIAFSQKGAMILAQRASIVASYDYFEFTRADEPRLLRFWLKPPNDPPSPGRWKAEPEEYAVGFAGSYRNTNGGVALGYGYAQNGSLASNACEYSLWTTAQNMRNAPPLRGRLEPGGALIVHGLFGTPSAPVRGFNEPPWTSYSVAYDDKPALARATGHLGSVRIHSQPCASPAAYSGPGYPANPPYIVTTVVVPACVGRDCPPPPNCPPNCPPSGNPVDIGIAKIGEVNLANPNGPYNFTIGVRNLGVPIATATTLTFTDVVPAGMTFTNVTSSNWTCAPLPGPPIPAGGTLTCTYTGTFPIASNQAMGWVTIVATGGNGPYENCAKLDQPDGDPSNDKACVTVEKRKGNLTVMKEVINKTNPMISTTGLIYPVTVTCGSMVTNLNLVDGLPQTIGGIPFNTICSMVEGPPPVPAGRCPDGSAPTWSAPPIYIPPSTLVQLGTASQIKVQNTLECKSSGGQVGELMLEKVVATPGIPSQPYPVTVTCGGTTTTLNLIDGVTQTVSNLPFGTICTIVEPPPPAPPNFCPPGSNPVWSTTYIPPGVPPGSVTISSTTVTVMVRNTLACSPIGGQLGALTVIKQVINRTQPQIPIGNMQFAISTSCQPGSSPAVVTNMPLPNGGSQTVSNLAYGTVCTISEVPPGPPPMGPFACTTPGYLPTWATVVPPPVTISGPTATATVQNILTCAPPDPTHSYLMVVKTIQNNTSASTASLASIVFPTVATCSGMPAANLPLTIAGPQIRYNIPVGSVCSVSETLPPPPTAGCVGGPVPTWVTPPTYSPASATVASGTGATITITNILNCALPGHKANIVTLKCPPPKVASANGRVCICPAGRVERGGKCVEPVSCVSPATLNKARTGCNCPQGMQLKGRSCVERERERKQPSATPGDVIRGIPGIGFPGRGGGGGGGGAGGGGGGKGGGAIR